MANLYSAGVTKVTAAAAGQIAVLWPTAAVRAGIREIGVFMGSAPASGPEIQLGRPANTPSGALTGVLGQALDVADVAAVSTLVTLFGTTAPTAPTNPLIRMTLPPSIGAGMVWRWEPGEMIVPASVGASAGLMLWQATALAVTYFCYVKWSE